MNIFEYILNTCHVSQRLVKKIPNVFLFFSVTNKIKINDKNLGLLLFFLMGI